MTRFLLESNKILSIDKSFYWQLVFFNDATGLIERHDVQEEFVNPIIPEEVPKPLQGEENALQPE